MSCSPLRTPWNCELLTSTLLLPAAACEPGSKPLLFATMISAFVFGSHALVATLHPFRCRHDGAQLRVLEHERAGHVDRALALVRAARPGRPSSSIGAAVDEDRALDLELPRRRVPASVAREVLARVARVRREVEDASDAVVEQSPSPLSSIGVVPTSQPHVGPGAPNWYQNGQSITGGFGIGSGGMIRSLATFDEHVVRIACAADFVGRVFVSQPLTMCASLSCLSRSCRPCSEATSESAAADRDGRRLLRLFPCSPSTFPAVDGHGVVVVGTGRWLDARDVQRRPDGHAVSDQEVRPHVERRVDLH